MNEVTFGLLVLAIGIPIIALADYLMDKYGLEEENLSHLE